MEARVSEGADQPAAQRRRGRDPGTRGSHHPRAGGDGAAGREAGRSRLVLVPLSRLRSPERVEVVEEVVDTQSRDAVLVLNIQTH